MMTREEAKQALLDSDWTQLPDVGLDAYTVAQYAIYRSELRNFVLGKTNQVHYVTPPVLGWAEVEETPVEETSVEEPQVDS